MIASEPGVGAETSGRLEKFTRLSEILLDWWPLPPRAAEAYLDIVLAVTPGFYAPGDRWEHRSGEPYAEPHPLDVLWSVLEELERESADDLEARLGAVTGADVTLNTLVQNIVVVWYNGFIDNHLPPADVYSSALVWQVIGANPPGIPGPYYGHWGYPPATPILPPSAGNDA